MLLKLSHQLFLSKLKFFLFEKTTHYLDLILYYLNVPAIKKVKILNVILFVGEQLPPRIPRMAKWIKRLSEYQPILVCHRKGFNEKFSDPCFDYVFLYRNEWHLKRILKQIKTVKLIHGFAPLSRYCNIARKYLSKPYIHDMQDVYSIYYEGSVKLKWLKRELPHEQECLLQAHGIVAHSMELNVALRKLVIGKKTKPKTLFFPLYCDDDFFQNFHKQINWSDIHVVYAGGIAGSFRNPNQYGNTQFHNLIQTLANQKIHFHIYPSPAVHSTDCNEYIAIAKVNPYFHFHSPIGQQDLTKELSKYDFGILPFFKNLSKQSENKVKYATSLKLFNYIEAGLPTIISEDIIFQNWILNRFGLAINIEQSNLNELRSIIESNSSEFSLKSINASREKLSLN
jgi:hypothetical protein